MNDHRALIFDMDGTMIDSMPYHGKSWGEFTRRHGMDIDVPDLMRRTTGRNGAECMRELFQRDLREAGAWALIHEKEAIYRELFRAGVCRGGGLSRLCRPGMRARA
jgi:beta-phosphoglucomutase-like phosphatase (HAD superfamily)